MTFWEAVKLWVSGKTPTDYRLELQRQVLEAGLKEMQTSVSQASREALKITTRFRSEGVLHDEALVEQFRDVAARVQTALDRLNERKPPVP